MFPVSRRAPFQWNGAEIWPRVNPNALYETFRVSDDLDSTYEVLSSLNDSIASADTVGVAWIISAAADTLTAADSAGAALTLRVAAADTVAISDSIGSMQVDSVEDTLAISDILKPTTYRPIIAADTVTTADLSRTNLFVSVVDTLSISDTAGAVLTLYAAASDSLAISDLVLDNITALQKVSVMNLDTGAMSEYTLSAVVTGMAQRNGVLYLATADGLYALDAAQDGVEDIVWHWRTGLTHLGTDQLKRPIDINMLGRAEGAIIAEVVTAREGEKRIDYFQPVNANRSTHRDVVIKIGKGLSSVYWAFGGSGTAPADQHECRILMWPLNRKR